ncbi:hypothetical protein D3C80_1426420 [compost metagenome]
MQLGGMKGVAVARAGIQPSTEIDTFAGGGQGVLQPAVPVAGDHRQWLFGRLRGDLQRQCHVIFHGAQGNIQMVGDLGEGQVVQAAEQEHLLHTAWQFIQARRQGSAALIDRRMVEQILKRREQAGHGWLPANAGRCPAE